MLSMTMMSVDPLIWGMDQAPGVAFVTVRVRLAMATPHGSRVPQPMAWAKCSECQMWKSIEPLLGIAVWCQSWRLWSQEPM